MSGALGSFYAAGLILREEFVDVIGGARQWILDADGITDTLIAGTCADPGSVRERETTGSRTGGSLLLGARRSTCSGRPRLDPRERAGLEPDRLGDLLQPQCIPTTLR